MLKTLNKLGIEGNLSQVHKDYPKKKTLQLMYLIGKKSKESH